eukprot:TRINITY_DN1642_c0_g1_i1.p1 TRINITY_DN1642_c0_g1~~TRINITY_DN1642_c0_g1_i1.p1  ORF type:complete len:661 (-),score=180.37 TRINITY_DN1642_c0_g1_i1:291-2273(-)
MCRSTSPASSRPGRLDATASLPLIVAIFMAQSSIASAFYVPGLTPLSYVEGQLLNVKVNSMTSTKTHIPFDHYHLHYCSNEGRSFPADYENFGEILYGDIVKPSLYNFKMLHNVTCELVCDPHTMDAKNKRTFNRFINDDYYAHMLLDNLPVFVEGPRSRGQHIRTGYRLGIPGRAPAVHNHLAFTVRYHVPVLKPGQRHTFAEAADALLAGGTAEGMTVGRVVGFTVEPHSIDHTAEDCRHAAFSPYGHPVRLVLDEKNPQQQVTWSFSVTFVEDTLLTWQTRWDVYLRSHDTTSKHWVSVLNGTVVLIFLSGLVAMIFLRVLHKDFNRYNDPENPDEAIEETGWKLVHGDVFREPVRGGLFASLIGTGAQLICMFLITFVLAFNGLMVPGNRGWLLTAMLLMYVFLGSTAGYVTARVAKMFRLQRWSTIFQTGLLFPGVCFGVFFIINLAMRAKGAANAVPFLSLMSLMALWFCVSLPLVIIGGVFGYRKPPVEHPVAVNPMPRWIPPQKPYLSASFTIPVVGVLPFGAAFMEIYFMLTSLWLGAFYQVFGFLFLVFVIVAITCAEITIALVYFMLCYENHRWWWRSFLACGSAGVHLFLYSLFYFLTRLQVTHMWSVMLYFGYMAILAVAFGLVCGTIGHIAAFFFVRKIYSSIKID